MTWADKLESVYVSCSMRSPSNRLAVLYSSAFSSYIVTEYTPLPSHGSLSIRRQSIAIDSDSRLEIVNGFCLYNPIQN